MKILAFSDVHSDEGAMRALVDRAGGFDMVVGAGDFCVMRRGLVEAIGVLRAIETPTVLVPGNGESFEELREACAGWGAAHVLHGSGCEIDGVAFFGLGGGVPVTPFGSWSYDLSEDAARGKLAGCPEGCVLVVHSPPKGACDRNDDGRSLGSEAIREVIVAKRPRVCLCGHIHACWGVRERIGETEVVNAGPRGMEVET